MDIVLVYSDLFNKVYDTELRACQEKFAIFLEKTLHTLLTAKQADVHP